MYSTTDIIKNKYILVSFKLVSILFVTICSTFVIIAGVVASVTNVASVANVAFVADVAGGIATVVVVYIVVVTVIASCSLCKSIIFFVTFREIVNLGLFLLK